MFRLTIMIRLFPIALVCAVCAAFLPARGEAALTMEDFWPVWVRTGDTAGDPPVSNELLWPIWEHIADASATDLFFRPLWNRRDEGEDGFLHALWPLFTTSWDGDSARTTLLPVYHRAWREDDEGSVSRLILFPFYLESRRDGAIHSQAFSLVYGHLRGWLGRDDIHYVLFPLYFQTRKESPAGVYRGTNVLWPLFGRGVGPGKDYWRIFPFWGRREEVGREISSFYLWPIFHHKTFDLNKEEPGSLFYFFPVYGYGRSSTSRLVSVIPPFFNVKWNLDGTHKHIDAPWPIVQRVSGPEIDRWRFWPVYGRTRRPASSNDFALWPLFQWGHSEHAEYVNEWKYLTPLWFERTQRYEDGTARHSIDSWPLFTWDRNRDGSARFAMINPLPFVEPEGFERAYGVFYTPIEYVENGEDEYRFRFLWRLLEIQKEEEGDFFRFFPLWSHRFEETGAHSWRALTGLVGHEREVEDGRYRNSIRLLWLLKIPGDWREMAP